MKKNLLWTMAAAFALASCSDTELVELPQQAQEQNAIAFSTYLGDNAQSRATVVTTETLGMEGFGVNAYYTGNDPFSSDESYTGNAIFMANTKVTYNADKTTWEYSPLKYWPNNAGDKVSFFAYGPYSVKDMVKDTNIEFTVAPDVKQQVDLIYHNQATNSTINMPKPAVNTHVEFKFDHALARIAFSVEAAVDVVESDKDQSANIDANTVINVKRVALVDADATDGTDGTYEFNENTFTGPFYKEGTLTLLNHSTTDTNGTKVPDSPWTISDEQKSKVQGFVLDGGDKNGGTDNKNNNFYRTVTDANGYEVVQLTKFNRKQMLTNEESYLMVIPQDLRTADNGGTSEGFKIYIEYDVITKGEDSTGDPSTITNHIVSDEALSVNFENGKAYKFNLVLGMASVQFDASVASWTEYDSEYEEDEWLPENMEKLDFEIADYDEQTGAHVFLIKSPADLAKMRDNVNSNKTYTLNAISRSSEVLYYAKASYKQTVSFSLAEYENWVPIGHGLSQEETEAGYDTGTYAFKGIYDGSYSKISGLTVEADKSNNYDGVGLFGMVACWDSEYPVIKNLTVEGNVTNTSGNAGGITGFLGQGTIENCSFTGTVQGYNAGGIVGYLYDVSAANKIINCYNGGTISSNSVLGGIAGHSMGGNIQACYNYGTLNYTGENGTYNGVGGILGFAYLESTTILGCYNSGSITTSINDVSGNIVGKIFEEEDTFADVSYCYYSDETLKAIGLENTKTIINNVSNTNDWTEAMNYMNYGLKANNIAYHYVASKVDDFPLILESGSVEGKAPAEDEIPAEGYKVTENAEEGTITYTVYTADGLYAWRAAVMNDDETMKDDDINLVLAADITLPAPADGQEYNWKPVGGAFVRNNYQTYKGNIDGGGKTITNLVIKSGNSYSGFIGMMDFGTIKNLKLADVDIRRLASENVAALLCNGSQDMTISGCEVVSGTVIGDAGLIGTISSGKVENCINRATVTNRGQYAGGVICEATIGCTITNCSNYGNVTLTNSGAPSYYAGGIVGKLSSSSTIENCTNYSTSILPEGHVGYIVGTASENSTLTGNKDEGNTGLPEAGDIS